MFDLNQKDLVMKNVENVARSVWRYEVVHSPSNETFDVYVMVEKPCILLRKREDVGRFPLSKRWCREAIWLHIRETIKEIIKEDHRHRLPILMGDYEFDFPQDGIGIEVPQDGPPSLWKMCMLNIRSLNKIETGLLIGSGLLLLLLNTFHSLHLWSSIGLSSILVVGLSWITYHAVNDWRKWRKVT